MDEQSVGRAMICPGCQQTSYFEIWIQKASYLVACSNCGHTTTIPSIRATEEDLDA